MKFVLKRNIQVGDLVWDKLEEEIDMFKYQYYFYT